MILSQHSSQILIKKLAQLQNQLYLFNLKNKLFQQKQQVQFKDHLQQK
jgi:hypothetical protein